jgi:MFS transporter, ACS family, tartrate transporter
MNLRGPAVVTTAEWSDVGQRARTRIAYRLLPFVFLMYVVNYIDRVNVSLANLRMSADLGFSDRVYGLGVSIFYLTYVLFEIPGAIITERWSARKWIARIMISWGLVTILTGFVHSAGQFYAARFFLGIAESSFFPPMIVYLTHWFRSRERSRAIACLYAAVPAASLIGSPLAGWLLGVHWWSLAGWRWLFILEGLPAIVLGVITVFYLTDWPAQSALATCGRTRLARGRIARGVASEKESSKLHDPGGVLRPANLKINCRLLPGSHRSSRDHLLDTNIREAPVGIF